MRDIYLHIILIELILSANKLKKLRNSLINSYYRACVDKSLSAMVFAKDYRYASRQEESSALLFTFCMYTERTLQEQKD